MNEPPARGSISYCLCQNIQPDGSLPRDFVLSANRTGDVTFVDGGIDGMLLYSCDRSEEPYPPALLEAIRLANDGAFERARLQLEAFARQNRAILWGAGIENWLFSRSGHLNAKNIYLFARDLLCTSAEAEPVKYALVLLQLIQANEDLKNLIRLFARCEEFTFFCLRNIRFWEDANQEVFSIARRTFGWGRIHAVAVLVPDREEIRRWMRREGCRNDVSPQYTALTITNRAMLLETLREEANLAREDFEGAGVLISALLDERPMDGISAFPRPGELFCAYLRLAERMDCGCEDYACIGAILDYLPSHDLPWKEEIQTRCEQLLASPRCVEQLSQAVQEGRVPALSERCARLYEDAALARMEQNFSRDFFLGGALIQRGERVAEVLSMFSRKFGLSPNRLPCGESVAPEWENALFFILGFVSQLPGHGAELVCAGLLSSSARLREQAIFALEFWQRTAPSSLRTGGIPAALELARSREKNPLLRPRLVRLQ